MEVPLLLSFWGTQLYGEWLMVAAIPTYLAIGDGGFASAASRDMGMRSIAGDREGALAVFQSTWVLLLVISCVVVLLSALLALAAPLTEWFCFKGIGSDDLRVVLLLLAVHVLVGFQGGLLNGGFWCSGRYPQGMVLWTTVQLFEFGGLASAVVLGGGPVQAAWGYLGGRLIGTFLMWLILHRVTPWLRYGVRVATWGVVKRLAAPAFASLAFPLGNALNIQGMRLVVGLVLGPPAVAVFEPIRTLSRFAMQPRAIVSRLMEPEMGIAFGSRDNRLLGELFKRSCQVALWLCLVVCLSLIVAGGGILPFWTAGKISMHWSLYILLLMTAAVNSFWYTALMVPYATNRHTRIAVVYSAVYGGIAFVVCYMGALVLGFIGVGIGLLFVEIVMTAFVLPVTLNLVEQKWGDLLRVVVSPPLFIFKI